VTFRRSSRTAIAATVCAVFVSDLRHFLDMPDDAPAPAQRLGLQLMAIVRAASARSDGTGARWRVRLLDEACTALDVALVGE